MMAEVIVMSGNDYVVGIGAANFDISGRSRSHMIMRDSNPGHFSFSSGGVTRNILENLSRLGIKTHLMTAFGRDAFGETVLKDCRKAGIGVSFILRVDDASSSSYISILDGSGDMQIAMSDMSVLEHITPSYLNLHSELIKNAAAVVCDPGLPKNTLDHLVSLTAGFVPLFTDAVSTTYARKLIGITGGFFCIKPNLMELSVISGMDIHNDGDIESACDGILDSGTKQIAVTLGKDGCFYKDRLGNRFFRKLREIDRMVNATGGGDAFMSLIIYGYINRFTAEETLDLALAAGIAAITSERTNNLSISREMLNRVIKEYSIEGDKEK